MHSFRGWPGLCLALGVSAVTALVSVRPGIPAAAGRRGGSLVVAERAEPRTLNPVTAVDNPSRAIIRRLTADLVHINRATQQTEPELAESWSVSPDRRVYTIALRRGLRFSDGHPCDADDVVFTFAVHLDPAVGSPQRPLLVVGGKPIAVRKIDSRTIRFELAEPDAVGERLFDSIAILPKHLLEAPYRAGALAKAWNLNTPPEQIAGLGPFRLQQYVPGDRIVLERNPYYWKLDANGAALPYLDRVTVTIVPNDETQALRFRAGELDVVNRLSAENYTQLSEAADTARYALRDAGPGLEYNFLFFNLNELKDAGPAGVRDRQRWFRQTAFRQAVSAALDREAMVRLIYQGRATALASQVTAGNRLWQNASLMAQPRSPERARALLEGAGFSWRSGGTLVDDRGTPVEFSVIVAASNAQRNAMATIVQDDLRQVGIAVRIVPLEFTALVARVNETRDYDACVLGIGSGDVDPSADLNVWTVDGGSHLWNLAPKSPAQWEVEIDRLMREQQTALPAERKRLYDRVQAIVADQLPIVPLVSPHILVAAKAGLGNFQPAILDHYTLWNIESLYWSAPASSTR